MSVDTTRPAKRARVEDTPVPSANNAEAGPSQESVPKRDYQYWLEDGNIVLLAGQTAFRIYKGLLARQSVVFRDMFVASDPDTGPIFDGCPAVRLSDSPEDLRALLQALMPVERRHVYRDRRPYAFDELVAMVRLGHKYQIEDVQEQSMDLLKTYFTNRFDTWEETVAPCARSDPRSLLSIPTINPIGAVHLARLLDEPSMLPVAFYQCAALGSKLLDGWMRHDGTKEYLSPEDTKRAIAGYGDMSHDCIPMIDRIFNPTTDDLCLSPKACSSQLERVLDLARDAGHHDVEGMLRPWSRWIREELEALNVCEYCKRALYDREKIERRRLWCDLPAIFDLSVEGWEVWEEP